MPNVYRFVLLRFSSAFRSPPGRNISLPRHFSILSICRFVPSPSNRSLFHFLAHCSRKRVSPKCSNWNVNEARWVCCHHNACARSFSRPIVFASLCICKAGNNEIRHGVVNAPFCCRGTCALPEALTCHKAVARGRLRGISTLMLRIASVRVNRQFSCGSSANDGGGKRLHVFGNETSCLEAAGKKDGHNLVAMGKKIVNEGVHQRVRTHTRSASFFRRAPACWTLILFICLRRVCEALCLPGHTCLHVRTCTAVCVLHVAACDEDVRGSWLAACYLLPKERGSRHGRRVTDADPYHYRERDLWRDFFLQNPIFFFFWGGNISEKYHLFYVPTFSCKNDPRDCSKMHKCSKHHWATVQRESCQISAWTCNLDGAVNQRWFMHWRVSEVLWRLPRAWGQKQRYEITISFPGFGIASDIELGMTFV